MMNGNRVVSLALLLTMGLQLAAPIVEASGPDEQVCRGTDQAVMTELGQLVTGYLNAWRSDSSLRKALFSSKIRKLVFREPGSPEYIESLRYIDGLQAVEPEAIYDLAKSLQLHWEAQYAVGLGAKRERRKHLSTEAGFVVGTVAFVAMGIAVLKNPAGAPKYFQIVRHLMPLAGTAAGAYAGDALNSSGLLDGDAPIAPAHVMRLGINTDDYHYSEDTLARDLIALTAGMAASTAVWAARALIVVRAARWLNMAATPAKLHPAVLIGSIVIGFLVEDGVKRLIDWREYEGLKDHVMEEVRALGSAIDSGADAQAYSHADALVRRVSNLAAYLNRPLNEAMKGYTEDVAGYADKYGEGTARYNSKLAERTEELSSDVREFLQDRELSEVGDYEGFLVRGYMLNHDERAIAGLRDSARSMARAYVEGFDHYIEHNEELCQLSFGSEIRDRHLRNFVARLHASKDRQLANALRAGRLPKNAMLVLLMTAALFRESGKEYLEDHANAMTSIIEKNDLITAVATASNEDLSGQMEIQ